MSHVSQNMKILVIDDKPSFGRIFVKRLKLKGYLVDYVTNLRDGLSRLKTEKFHAVFVDTPFDMISESQVLETLQKNNIFDKSSIFLFSSVDISQTDLNDWNTSGLFSYLKKPVKFNVIINELENVKIDSSYDISENPTFTDPPSYDYTSVPNPDEKLTQLQNQIRELEQHVEDSTISDTAGSTNVTTSQVSVISDDKDDYDEATPEQLEKLTQLQNQIRELEQHVEDSTISDTAGSTNVTTSQVSVISDDKDDYDEATPEQLEKLTQLQNQIRELEQHVEDSTISDTAGSTNVTTSQVYPDTTIDSFTKKLTAFQNIMATMKSFKPLDSDTSVPDTSVPDTSVPDTSVPDTSVPDTSVPDNSKITVEQEIKDTLSEIDLLKKELLHESTSENIDGKKKHKIITMSQTKASKSNKKSTTRKTKKSTTRKTKKSTTRKTKKSTTRKS